MTSELREELSALAETQTFSPDPSVWDRGRRVRRRDQAVRGAAVLAVVAAIAGVGVLSVRPDPVGPAGNTLQEGAIPSVIPQPDGPVVTDLAIGRASVAYVDEVGQPVLVDAATGKAHSVELPDFPGPKVFELAADFRRGPWLALSADGQRLAYPTTAREERDPGQFGLITTWYRVFDLTTGESELVDLPPSSGTPVSMAWTADGRIAVDVPGRPTLTTKNPPDIAWTVDPSTGESTRSPLTGVTAPGGEISATYPPDAESVRSVPFETADGTDPDRELPADLYPDGAAVTPVGWADDSLLVAQVDAPAGSYVEGAHLVLLTSPDRPVSEWTYRILVRDVPDASSLSLAVDLIPDLDGTSSQELTHDFSASSGWGTLPEALFGVLAVLLGLAFIGSMGRRA